MAITRSAELAVMTTESPLQAIEAPTFLKSYRCAISFTAWFSALSTSCRSTLLTTSNDDSLAMTPPVLAAGARFFGPLDVLLSFHPHCSGCSQEPPVGVGRVTRVEIGRASCR